MDDANRRLAGILAADVVGYSAMVGKDEPGTLARVRTLRTDLIEPLAAEHGGRLFKTTGDGFLAAFASAVQALRCAIAIQERLSAQPDGLRLRIGVHQGEVVAEGDDLLGDGVIIAARLEPLAEPGGICISARVREDAAGKMALECDDLGTPELKNIAAKVQVFHVRLSTAERPALPLPDKPSIAVLAFTNMSGDPEQEYFADGVVDDIITALSRTGWLFVIARNSSFAYKGKSPDIRAVGRELGVRYVLEGSIRRSTNRIRITCQLIEAATGGHVWADRFNSELEDIFDLQDQITETVIGAIEPSLKRAEIARATAKPTERLDAYDLYLRAWTYYDASAREASDLAISLLRRALEIDPTYVRAKALLASAYTTRVAQRFHLPGDREMGIALAREILDIETDDPEVLCRGGFAISELAGDYSVGFTALNRALRLNPNSVLVLNRLAWVHCHANDTEPAVALLGARNTIESARSLDGCNAGRARNRSPLGAAERPSAPIAPGRAGRSCSCSGTPASSPPIRRLRLQRPFAASLTRYPGMQGLLDRTRYVAVAQRDHFGIQCRIDPRDHHSLARLGRHRKFLL
jgi:adenylate cyclase